VLIIPGDRVKNGDERLVVLNRVARDVIESVRGKHPEFVFAYRVGPIETMNNTAWQSARERAGLPEVRVHDLKHTFGRWLRAAGVTLEDRQDLLGHRSGRIMTHYSAAQLQNLLEAANRVCETGSRKTPALVLFKKKAPAAIAAGA
jgi:integrase